jgi:transcriptional regulator with XRE-family HTH domain
MRNLLGWNQHKLAEKSGVSVPTIANLEADRNIRNTNSVLQMLITTYENHGVKFIESDNGIVITYDYK